jgi:peptidyl-prolyl cis-trans isomerase C
VRYWPVLTKPIELRGFSVRTSILVWLVLPLALGAGCRRGDSPGAGAGTGTGTGGPERADRKLVAAQVGKALITVGQLEDELNRLHPAVRVRFTSPERRKEFLKNMVRFEVLAEEAKRRELQRDPEVVRRVKRAMIDVMMDQLRSSLVKIEDITDVDVEEYYNKNIEQFQQPAKVRASVIVTKTKAEAAVVLAQAKQKNGDVRHFATLVRQFSIDPVTKVKRGDLGFFAKGDPKVPKELSEAAFAIESLWTLGGPVQTEKGFAVLMKTGETQAVNRSLETEKHRIKNRLFNERRLKTLEKYVDDLQQKATVKIYDKNLEKVELESRPRPEER